MNHKENSEILKRKLIELENKVEKLNNHRNILINLLNEAKTRQNIKLNNSLKGLNLEEEVLHLKDLIGFHGKEISIYKNKINALEIEASQQEILEQDLDYLDKETESTLESEKDLGQKEEPEDFDIKIPTPEEIEKEIEKPEIKIEKKQPIKEEVKEPAKIEALREEEKPKIEVKEEETKKQIKELFEGKKEIIKPIRFKEKLEAIKEPIKNIFDITTRLNKNKLVAYGIPIILLLLVTSVLFISKPEITGYVTLTKEETYTDNLNLIINESGNYTWTIDKPGDIQSIKASGRVKGNGTVKVYIEKDGERYLIYDNKAAD